MSKLAPYPSSRRGEIWLVDWSPGRGSEQLGRRPAIVVQNDQGNSAAGYPNTIVVAVSSTGKPVPFHVLLKATKENGLRADSYVKCEQVLTISKARLTGRPWGKLNKDEMDMVDAALRLSLGLS